VVNEPHGTAYWFRGRGIEMAGKTGTSQVIGMNSKKLFAKCEDHPYQERHHGIFAAFAPAYNPRIAVAVVVEHGCHGSTAAAPVARDIITRYMKKYLPEEYQANLKKEKEKAKIIKMQVEKREKKQKLEEARLKALSIKKDKVNDD
jgi:penicillin-binding protein 2